MLSNFKFNTYLKLSVANLVNLFIEQMHGYKDKKKRKIKRGSLFSPKDKSAIHAYIICYPIDNLIAFTSAANLSNNFLSQPHSQSKHLMLIASVFF